MNKVILATHGDMSAGAKHTAEMILGELPNLYAISTQRNETESVMEAAKRLLDSFEKEDQAYILTDVLGGSVNNDMLSLMEGYPGITVICGMNMSLILNLITLEDTLDADGLAKVIDQARSEIINCSEMVNNATENEEDDL